MHSALGAHAHNVRLLSRERPPLARTLSQVDRKHEDRRVVNRLAAARCAPSAP